MEFLQVIFGTPLFAHILEYANSPSARGGKHVDQDVNVSVYQNQESLSQPR